MLHHLLSPVTLRGVVFRNRLGMSPMCTYSAPEAKATPWHLVHLGARAQAGLGLVMVEATAVAPEGRITPWDLGLWTDEQGQALKPVADIISAGGAVPGIQVAHAGRKAGSARPWDGGKPLRQDQASPQGWRRVGPSALPWSDGAPVPEALSCGEIQDIVRAFGQSARRAREAGFKLLEIHSAHGYLLHSFLSPLSNLRTDAYGGSFERRLTFLREVVAECRRHWGDDLPLGVRLSMADWDPEKRGLTGDDTVRVAAVLKEMDVDFVDCSSGGNTPRPVVEVSPGYQVPFARRVKQEVGLASMAVGLITTPEQAAEVIASGSADFVLLGRALLRDPQWLLAPLRPGSEHKGGILGTSKADDGGDERQRELSLLRDLIPFPYRRGFEG